MRRPKHMRAERELAMADDAIAETGIPARNRKAIPPNAYDDLIVSHRRGQDWARKRDD